MSTGAMKSSARSGFVLGLSTGLVLASACFLTWPELALTARTAARTPTTTASPVSAPMTTPGAGAASMEAATLALKTRLATQGGPDDQWELLAQSYDFLGRGAEAKLAREHRTSADDADGGLRDAVAASAMLLSASRPAGYGSRVVQAKPSAAEALIASAEQHRSKREFKEACAAYAEAVRRGVMTADGWADYADAQASLSGRLAGGPEQAIARALALDPRHAKALWLKASLEHEQHRYREALATWRRLLAVVPPGSSDARIVEANIAEATRLAKG